MANRNVFDPKTAARKDVSTGLDTGSGLTERAGDLRIIVAQVQKNETVPLGEWQRLLGPERQSALEVYKAWFLYYVRNPTIDVSTGG